MFGKAGDIVRGVCAGRGSRRPIWLAALFATLLAPVPALAASPVDLTQALAGAWELSNPKASRSCRLTLGADPVPGGHVVGAPPACRIAMPLLVQVSGWTMNADRRISLLDSAGNSVIEFQSSGGAPQFTARAGAESYVLTPVTGPRDADRTGSIAAALAGKGPDVKTAQDPRTAASRTAQAGVQTAAADAAPLRNEAIVGLYGVAREKNKPVCSIELTSRPLKKAGLYTAVLSGGCIDTGLKLFDPIAWRTDKATLYLIARKGHEQSFAVGADGIFAKDPPSGAQLFLKKQ